MEEVVKQNNPHDKLESFLERACAAEADGDFREANRLFRMALRCEGMLRDGITDSKKYADEAGPVYPEPKLLNNPDEVPMSQASFCPDRQ